MHPLGPYRFTLDQPDPLFQPGILSEQALDTATALAGVGKVQAAPAEEAVTKVQGDDSAAAGEGRTAQPGAAKAGAVAGSLDADALHHPTPDVRGGAHHD